VGKTQDSAPDRFAKYMNVWAQLFSCQQLMPDPFDAGLDLVLGQPDFSQARHGFISKNVNDVRHCVAC
jgi:hypothetical protein